MFNRRNFLKYISLGSAVVGLPKAATNVYAQPKPTPGQPGLIALRGRVHANGKGISGVAVTDGMQVVRTNSQGMYDFTTSNKARFVYISLPAGYAFPAKSGMVQFYQPIDTAQSVITSDFELQKLNADDRKHNFVVWADTQMISERDAAELKSTAAPDLKALVQSYGKDTLFHAIGCGDLVWDKFELFEDYKQAAVISGVPFFNVIGNHDMDLEARGDDDSSKTFQQQFGPTYYSFNRGAVHYVVLDDVFFVGTAKKYIGYISEAQLAWLEQDLAIITPGSTIVVSLHIPTNTGVARRANKQEEMGGTVQNRQHLYKLLSPFKAHIMSGHTHMNEKWTDGNVTEHVHGTVCGAWWTGPICSDGTPRGYGVYEVDGSDIRWYYKGTGLAKEEQIRLYAKGSDKANPGAVVANIWNWDPQWKVEWAEDGVAKGVMEQRIGLDPWAIELYNGPQLPEKHKFVDPTLTDHLFYAVPSAGAKAISVTATDRFGNVYKAQMNMV